MLRSKENKRYERHVDREQTTIGRTKIQTDGRMYGCMDELTRADKNKYFRFPTAFILLT